VVQLPIFSFSFSLRGLGLDALFLSIFHFLFFSLTRSSRPSWLHLKCPCLARDPLSLTPLFCTGLDCFISLFFFYILFSYVGRAWGFFSFLHKLACCLVLVHLNGACISRDRPVHLSSSFTARHVDRNPGSELLEVATATVPGGCCPQRLDLCMPFLNPHKGINFAHHLSSSFVLHLTRVSCFLPPFFFLQPAQPAPEHQDPLPSLPSSLFATTSVCSPVI